MAFEAGRVAAAVPLLMVHARGDLGVLQKRPVFAFLFQPPDGFHPLGDMGFHDLELLGRQGPGFVQYGVADEDLAQVVQLGRRHHILHVLPGQEFLGIHVVFEHMVDEQFHIALRPADVPAGQNIPELHQFGQGTDYQTLEAGNPRRFLLDHLYQAVVEFFQFRLLPFDEQVVFNALEENGGGKGFGHIIDRPQGQALQFVRFLRLGRHEDDGDIRVPGLGLQYPDDVETVHAGHAYVQKDQIGSHAFQKFKKPFRRRQRIDFVKILEHVFSNVQIGLIVVDQHDCLSISPQHLYFPFHALYG